MENPINKIEIEELLLPLSDDGFKIEVDIINMGESPLRIYISKSEFDFDEIRDSVYFTSSYIKKYYNLNIDGIIGRKINQTTDLYFSLDHYEETHHNKLINFNIRFSKIILSEYYSI